MWELVKAGGWLMLPLILSSIFTVAITIERYIRLQRSQVLPRNLIVNGAEIDALVSQLELDEAKRSPLGRILSSGYAQRDQGEQFARAQMEATASQEITYLE
ncbi:MAG TPA: MotA/TolQ/ExbB proton channel family protein, partial [Acinetobacter sp.]|nr:MotA/TolQ/ExbB proton channel family protein [Acinetobacter sp.]